MCRSPFLSLSRALCLSGRGAGRADAPEHDLGFVHCKHVLVSRHGLCPTAQSTSSVCKAAIVNFTNGLTANVMRTTANCFLVVE
jgi:hypothetical protein